MGLGSDQVREMKQLQDENNRLKQLVAELHPVLTPATHSINDKLRTAQDNSLQPSVSLNVSVLSQRKQAKSLIKNVFCDECKIGIGKRPCVR